MNSIVTELEGAADGLWPSFSQNLVLACTFKQLGCHSTGSQRKMHISPFLEP